MRTSIEKVGQSRRSHFHGHAWFDEREEVSSLMPSGTGGQRMIPLVGRCEEIAIGVETGLSLSQIRDRPAQLGGKERNRSGTS